jgi:hypothetical protein
VGEEHKDALPGPTEFATITAPPETPDSNIIRRRRVSSDRDVTPIPHKRPQTPPAKCLPLVSFTSTTVFGSISRYTSYFNEIRRDPTGLARRVIANAWCSNWARLGRLSWWVLGLFLGPSGRADSCDKPSVDDNFNMHYYSAVVSKARRGFSAAAEATKGTGQQANVRARSSSQMKVAFRDDIQSNRPRCNECIESSFGRSMRLWAKFSFALVLAVGVAVKDGPESLLKDPSSIQDQASFSSTGSVSDSPVPSESLAYGEDCHQHSASSRRQPDSVSGRLTSIQNLSVADFKDN